MPASRQRRYDQAQHGWREKINTMKSRYIFVAFVALCAAMTGGSGSADGRTPEQPDNAAADSPTIDNGQVNQLQFKTGKTLEQLRSELTRPMTPEEVATAIARTERDSSPAHYYPDAPDDPRMDPLRLNDQGEEEPSGIGE
jgi:hypothetical protein